HRSGVAARGYRRRADPPTSLVRTRRVASHRLVRPIAFAYHGRVSDERAVDVADLATARTLIATLQDELTRVQRENASTRRPLSAVVGQEMGPREPRSMGARVCPARKRAGGSVRADRNGFGRAAGPTAAPGRAADGPPALAARLAAAARGDRRARGG